MFQNIISGFQVNTHHTPNNLKKYFKKTIDIVSEWCYTDCTDTMSAYNRHESEEIAYAKRITGTHVGSARGNHQRLRKTLSDNEL